MLSPAVIHGISDHHSIFPREQKWHTLFISLGQHSNPWGLKFDDQQAFDIGIANGKPFRTPSYEPLMQGMYLEAVRERPDIILRNWFLNTLEGMTAWSAHRFPVGIIHILWIGALLGAWLDKRVRIVSLLWLIQCVSIGFVTEPSQGYLWETLGLLTLAGVSGYCIAYTRWAEHLLLNGLTIELK